MVVRFMWGQNYLCSFGCIVASHLYHLCHLFPQLSNLPCGPICPLLNMVRMERHRVWFLWLWEVPSLPQREGLKRDLKETWAPWLRLCMMMSWGLEVGSKSRFYFVHLVVGQSWRTLGATWISWCPTYKATSSYTTPRRSGGKMVFSSSQNRISYNDQFRKFMRKCNLATQLNNAEVLFIIFPNCIPTRDPEFHWNDKATRVWTWARLWDQGIDSLKSVWTLLAKKNSTGDKKSVLRNDLHVLEIFSGLALCKTMVGGCFASICSLLDRRNSIWFCKYGHLYIIIAWAASPTNIIESMNHVSHLTYLMVHIKSFSVTARKSSTALSNDDFGESFQPSFQCHATMNYAHKWPIHHY